MEAAVSSWRNYMQHQSGFLDFSGIGDVILRAI